ncbi:hypothetical protein [Senegalia massiliensis]|uniref:Uncharacterized protein n=1 Tax=Senegalia massiliensis TaxID=1720316 RepID=A0A845QVR5_9CLOT|nr:hypothetical protein [Senegalia massiliensis]NBI06094.1 hypothetical protein [Senegalia massiliensis]
MMEKLLRLENKLSSFESQVVVTNILQNINDYQTLNAWQSFGSPNMKVYANIVESFYKNAINGIELLNQLCIVYKSDLLFEGDIKNKKEVDTFIKDLIISRYF